MESTADTVAQDSVWQKGSSYLRDPIDRWPIDRNFAARKDMCIPEEEILKRYRGQMHHVTTLGAEIGIHVLLDPASTNDWNKLVKKTAILLLPFLHKHGITDNSIRIEKA